jgi:hypothetical protein
VCVWWVLIFAVAAPKLLASVVNSFLPLFSPPLFLSTQFKSTVMLSERRPFPPGPNPWKYVAAEGEVDLLQYSMMKSLLATVFAGAFLGWLIAKPIPLFPNWIGAILGASALGGATTFRDSRGDLMRYLGHCVNSCVAVMGSTLDDVLLKERLGKLLSRLLFFLKGVDKKYHIVARLQDLLSDLIGKLTVLVGR